MAQAGDVRLTELRFWQVDAFADRPFTGNPAAVIPLNSWLDDAVLQAIAEENNLAETAFTVRGDGTAADYELRWFTPTTEVALCGHATLASGHVLLGDRASLRFATRKSGVLEVRRDGGGYALDLPATEVAPADHGALRAALGLPNAPLFLSASGDTAIVLADDAAAVRACAPDMRALAAVPVLAIVTAPGDGGFDVVSRVFVPAWGVPEDPVTGAAHAALTPFWARRLGRDSFSAFQASRRGGRLRCTLVGQRAVLGGSCVTVIEGKLRLR